jgi:hypothetical protein
MCERRVSVDSCGAVRTEDIALVETIGGNDCALLAVDTDTDTDARARRGALGHALVMRRLGCSAGFMVVNRAGRLRLGLGLGLGLLAEY